VLWFGEPLANERSALAAAGWYVRSIHPDPAMAIGLRGRDRLLAVLDLRHLDAPPCNCWRRGSNSTASDRGWRCCRLAQAHACGVAALVAALPLAVHAAFRPAGPGGAMRQQFDAEDTSADEGVAGRGRAH
jgi:hypothetical protein